MKRVLTAFLLFLLIPSLSFSDELLRKCAQVKKQFPQFHVEKILKGPIPGMCELWAGTNVIYYFPDQKLFFFGQIFSTKGYSLTERSRERMIRERISRLDLRKAICWGRGPVRVIFVTDPDCPFCRRTEKFLLSEIFEDKITAYIFLYPLKQIHPDAEKHALMVLSSKNPVETLLKIAEGEKSFPIASISKKRLNEMVAQVKKLGVGAVPLVVIGKNVVRGANLERISFLIEQELRKGGDRGKGGRKRS